MQAHELAEAVRTNKLGLDECSDGNTTDASKKKTPAADGSRETVDSKVDTRP